MRIDSRDGVVDMHGSLLMFNFALIYPYKISNQIFSFCKGLFMLEVKIVVKPPGYFTSVFQIRIFKLSNLLISCPNFLFTKNCNIANNIVAL
jgi:hypothetical protein